MRGNSDESIQHLRRRFEETVASTAAAHGCTAEVGGPFERWEDQHGMWSSGAVVTQLAP